MRGGSAEETNVAFQFGVNFQGNSRELKAHSRTISRRIFDDLFNTFVQLCDRSNVGLVALWDSRRPPRMRLGVAYAFKDC